MQFSRRDILGSLLGTTAMSGLSPSTALARPPAAPNIITIVLDDVGYSDLGCFGGEIRTPAIDDLAAAGLRYVHFDTKAICSSTRAALLTGRNSHSVNMPDVPDVAAYLSDTPGPVTKCIIPRNAENIAQVLKRRGYATWAIGKWHLIPLAEIAENAGRDSWPLQRGFDYFYGFPRGWTDQYKPELVENNAHLKRDFPAGYHLSADLADRAIAMIEGHVAKPGAAPFYLNLAFGTAHSPLQVAREYSAPYDATYESGWDRIRVERYERMKRMGIIPTNTLLPPRDPVDRAWTDLSDDEKAVFARHMAIYAGFLEHCDRQIGRVLDALKRHGQAQNTLIILLSDNGAASEGGQAGEFDGLYKANTLTPAAQRARIDELGTAKLQSEYPRPWAMVGTTPLRRYKLWPYSGGTRTPMIVRWPGQVPDPGAIRRQFVDVVDIAPTVLAAAGTNFDTKVNGVTQIPVAGRSILPTVRDSKAKGRQVQYFELRGNRAITSGSWRAVAMHGCGKAYEEDRWELYNLASDFSETTDLADQFPEKLRELQAKWNSEWARFGTGPLAQPSSFVCVMMDTFDQPSQAPSGH